MVIKDEEGKVWSTRRFSLDVNSHRSQVMVKTFKGNNAVKLIITLTESGKALNLKPGNLVLLTGTRSSAKVFARTYYVGSGNEIIFDLDKDITKVAGITDCDVTVYSSYGDVTVNGDTFSANAGGILSAAKFSLDIADREIPTDETEIEFESVIIDTVLGAAAAEWAREQAENARVQAENERDADEKTRDGNEGFRRLFENDRRTNEIDRANNENERIENENNRVENEALRVADENERKEAEETRVSQEENRQATYKNAFEIANNALTVANEAKNAVSDVNITVLDAKATADSNKEVINSMKLEYNKQTGELSFVRTEGSITHKKNVDLPLESIITDIDDIVKADGTRYLVLYLENGKTKEIELNAIFNGFARKELENDFEDLEDQFVKVTGQFRSDIDGLYSGYNDLTDSGYGLIPQLERNKADKSVVESISKEVTDHNRRIEQLESLSLRYIEDTSIWHTKDVPSDVGKKALVDMIGGMSHTSNNKLPFPYPYMNNNVQNGVSVTYNKDGSITLNGVLKNSSQVDIVLFENYDSPLCVNGYFTIGVDLPENCSFLCNPELVDEGLFDNPEQYDYPQEVKSSLMDRFNYLFTAFIASQGDVIFDNYTFYPMFNEGTTTLPYEPYIAGIKHAKVKAIRAMVDGEVLSSVEVPKEIYDRADWGLGVSNKIYNFIDLNNDTYCSKCAICTFDGSEDWKEKPANGKIRFMTNLNGCASPYIEDTKTATPAVANYYTSVSASKNLNQHNKSYTFGSNSFFAFDKDIQYLDSWIEHLKNNPLTVVYAKADVDYVKLDNFPQEAKALVMDTSKGELVADNDENLPAPSTITYITHRGL